MATEKLPKFYRLRKALTSYLRKNGPYAFCMMRKEILSKDDLYIHAHYYKATREELKGVIEEVFGKEYGYAQTVEQFLEDVKTITAYGIPKQIKKTNENTDSNSTGND